MKNERAPSKVKQTAKERLEKQRIRQQKLRDSETLEQRKSRNAKKAEYQSQVRNEETKEEYLARLKEDRDQHYNKMASDRKVVIAVNNRERFNDGTDLVAVFENEMEKKIYSTWEKRQTNQNLKCHRKRDQSKSN